MASERTNDERASVIAGAAAASFGSREDADEYVYAVALRMIDEAVDAEIARLTRELKEAREILRDLADDEDAGIVWTGTLVVCAYCYATDRYDVEHNGDCPVVRARRALVATPDTEGEA